METKIELIPQKVEDGWALFYLTRLEVTVKRVPKQYESTDVTAVFDVPDASPIKLAIPLFPGNGPVPENTIALINIQDQAQKMIDTLESAIDAQIKSKGSW